MLKNLRKRVQKFFGSITPGNVLLRGAGKALILFFTISIAYSALQIIVQDSVGLGVTLAVLRLIGCLLLFTFAVFIAIRLFAKLPVFLTLGIIFILTFAWFHFGSRGGLEGYLAISAALIFPIFFLGIGFTLLKRQGKGSDGAKWSRALAIGVTLAGAFGFVFAAIWFFNDGEKRTPPPNAAKSTHAEIEHISAPDPSRPGAFVIKYLTYGSGKDLHRSEFGRDADLITEPVDASAFVENWDKKTGWARTRFWGFGPKTAPLQGRVWYPDGRGAFPLVLIVHGNHTMEAFSDPGYAYLGELLASRGYIAVSVDENFLNSSFSSRLDDLNGRNWTKELDARGWLLLEHLRLWHDWNASPGNPFHNKIDTARIGLIGHSRGGEAVAIAAMFNKMSRYPDDANVTFDYNFNIRGVVAIAPVDRYPPAGLWTTVEDVDYFVLHGSHDGDVQSFRGSRQFERVRFSGTEYHFKTSLYIYGANHGQFNTVWGRADSPFPWKNLLNLRDIMPPEEQRRIAKVYISAFLEASLNKKRDYLPLFQDARRGDDWLPETIYLTHFDDSKSQYLQTFEEDIDVTTTTLSGGKISGKNLKTWKERRVALKQRHKATNAVYLGWERKAEDEIANYTIQFPKPLPVKSAEDFLVFTLAADKKKAASSDSASTKDDENPVIDFTIELCDQDSNKVRLPLSNFSLLQPQISVQVRKARIFNSTPTSEPVYQIFQFPFKEFQKANPTIDLTRLQTLRFVFDKSPHGQIILDHIGIRSSNELD